MFLVVPVPPAIRRLSSFSTAASQELPKLLGRNSVRKGATIEGEGLKEMERSGAREIDNKKAAKR